MGEQEGIGRQAARHHFLGQGRSHHLGASAGRHCGFDDHQGSRRHVAADGADGGAKAGEIDLRLIEGAADVKVHVGDDH